MNSETEALRIALQDEVEKFEFLTCKIRDEGFHYCFTHYSDFREIQDDQFHKLREEYLLSSGKLLVYVETKLKELTDELDELEEII